MGEKRLPEVVVTLISVAFQALAFPLYFVERNATTLPSEWLRDFTIFLSLSLALTLALLLITNRIARALLLLCRALVYLFITFPLGELISVRFLLLGAIFMDIGISFPLSKGIPSIGIMGFVFFLNQKPVHAFGMVIPQPPLIDTFVTLFISIAVSIPVVILKSVMDSLSEERQSNSRLNSSVRQLTSANSEFLQYASIVERESVANERNRITRDLHDILGQALTNIIMMMDAAIHRPDAEPEEVRKVYQWTRDQAQSCLEETRAALYELRSIRHDQVKGIRAVQRLIETFSSLTGVQISVEWGNLPWELDDDIDQVVYRVIQESLSNSFRHGMATLVEIHFFIDREVLHLMIRDNGKGGDDSKRGIGQTGMEERVRKLGGEISFQRETLGYVVAARIPLPEEVLAEAR
jgi:signal transduction histidine kinase